MGQVHKNDFCLGHRGIYRKILWCTKYSLYLKIYDLSIGQL